MIAVVFPGLVAARWYQQARPNDRVLLVNFMENDMWNLTGEE
jgi:hypothetical protein